MNELQKALHSKNNIILFQYSSLVQQVSSTGLRKSQTYLPFTWKPVYRASGLSALGCPLAEKNASSLVPPSAACGFTGQIHSESEAGCIVSWTTASNCSRICSRST